MKIHSENIKGSSGAEYVLVVSKNEKSISITCSCPAGVRGKKCKHKDGFVRRERDSNSTLWEELCSVGYGELVDRYEGLLERIAYLQTELKNIENSISKLMKG